MSDFSKLLKIVSETTSGAVASVAQPLTTEAQKRDDESSASNIDVVEYGNWENSALVTGDKLKRERKKAAKVVKSIYGEGSEQKRKSILESLQEVSSDDFNIGDPVEITGPVQFKGSTGEVVDVRNGFVVVDLYNHGKRSFHASDVSYNDYADSDEEEAHHYDREKDARDREGMAEGSLNEGQYEMMLRNGQVKKFVAKDDADAKRIAAGHGAKSVIKLRGGVPAGKIAEQGVAEAKGKLTYTPEPTEYGVFPDNKKEFVKTFLSKDLALSHIKKFGGKLIVLDQYGRRMRQGVEESQHQYDLEVEDVPVPYSNNPEEAEYLITVGVNYTDSYDEYNGDQIDSINVYDLSTNKEVTDLLDDKTLDYIYSEVYKHIEHRREDDLEYYQASRGEQMKRDRDMGYFESNQGVAEGGILKSIKRGMQGWDKNAVGPAGEKLGDPKEIVRRNKAHDDETLKGLHKAASSKGPGFPFNHGAIDPKGHSPASLQKRVLDREMKKRGLGEQGVAEGSGDKVHLKTPKHGLADHPGRNTGVGLRTFAATPAQDRCPKCNSLFKNHYQKQGVAEGFLSGLEVYMDPKDGKVKKYPAKSTKPTTGLDVYMDPKDGKVKKYPVKQGVAEDEYVDDTYEKPVLLSFELYNIKTNERVYGPFKAYDLFGAAIKADDYLEAKGMNGKGLTVRRVKKQGVAEGLSDVVKGIKRTIKGKEDPKDVEHTYARVARRDTQDANKLQNQAAYDARDKSIKRWEKVNKVVNKEGVAEDSDPCWDNYKQIGMKTKNGKQVPNCVPKESVEEATTKPAKVEAYGYKYNNRDQRIVWRKIFPSIDAMNKWAEKTNATVIGTREV